MDYEASSPPLREGQHSASVLLAVCFARSRDRSEKRCAAGRMHAKALMLQKGAVSGDATRMVLSARAAGGDVGDLGRDSRSRLFSIVLLSTKQEHTMAPCPFLYKGLHRPCGCSRRCSQRMLNGWLLNDD
jgi:hypothetical protein